MVLKCNTCVTINSNLHFGFIVYFYYFPGCTEESLRAHLALHVRLVRHRQRGKSGAHISGDPTGGPLPGPSRAAPLEGVPGPERTGLWSARGVSGDRQC